MKSKHKPTTFRALESLNNVVRFFICEYYHKLGLYGVYDDISIWREVMGREILWDSNDATIFRSVQELYIECAAYSIAQLESHNINVSMTEM